MAGAAQHDFGPETVSIHFDGDRPRPGSSDDVPGATEVDLFGPDFCFRLAGAQVTDELEIRFELLQINSTRQ